MHIYTKLKNEFSFVKGFRKMIVLFAVILFGAASAYAQVPPNDDPCNAINLTATAACSYQPFSNVDASNSTTTGLADPTCASFADADVWFRTTVPPNASSVTIDLINGTTGGINDAAAAAYTATGTCPSLVFTEVGCNDDGSTNFSMPRITVTAAPGTVIYIRVFGNFGVTGNFGICVTANIPPPNDECAASIPLTVNPNLLCGVVTGGTTAIATTSPNLPVPTCGVTGANNDDVWFNFTATATAHRVSLLNVTGSSTAMLIAVYSGTCTSLTQIGCIAGNTLDLGGLTVNTNYLVRVYTNVAGAGSATFNICVGTTPPPPANDDCLNAIALTNNPNYNCGIVTAGTTVSATPSNNLPTPTCNPTGINDDVWFKFTATSQSHRVSLLNIAGNVTAMSMNIYSGTCGALVNIACNTTNTADLVNLVINDVYYVRVYTNVATVGSNAAFNICIGTPPPPPANDECAAAVTLTVNPTLICTTTTAGTTVSATENLFDPNPSCDVAGSTDDDVWFKFTATSTTHRISLLNVTGGTTAMAMVVYSGTCGAFTQIDCNTTSLTQISGLLINTVYYVRVFTNVPTFGVNSNFNICVATPPPPPANDECLGAITATVNPTYTCTNVTAGSTASATPSITAPLPSCNATGINDDVWFKFTATNATHRISLLNITGGNVLGSVVYTGTCTALTEINCSAANLYNVAGLIVNQTYYVRVFTTSTSPTVESNFNLCIGTPPPPPANDECAGAISLTVNPNQLCGVTLASSTEGATLSTTTPFPTCSPANGWNDDVWFSFVAVGNNHRVSLLNVSGTSVDMVTAVYQGTCGALTQIACIDNPDPNVLNLTSLTPNSTYYIRVMTASSGPVNANFSICVGTPGPGASCDVGNPFCSTSGVVYPSVTNQPSLGGGTGTIYGCLGSTPNPTWFAFQVATAGNLVFQVNQTTPTGGGIDVDYAAWGPFTSQSNGCNQLSTVTPPIQPISCSFSTAATETITIPNALVGQWYIVLITNFNGGAGTIAFNTTTGNVGSTNCSIVCTTTAANSGPVCAGGTFNLTSTSIAGSTFSWTGPGGFTSTQANPSNITAPTTPGSYVYTITTTIGSTACSASTTLVVTAQPAAPTVTSPITYCQNASAAPLTATVSSPGNTLLFYTTPTGGTGVTTLIPSTATLGTTTYYVTQSAGSCQSPRAEIQVIVLLTTTPAPLATSPVSYCIGATATALSATALPTATLNWYGLNATGGTPSATAPIPPTNVIGTFTYYVSQTIASCESPRTAITVNITASTTAPPTVTTPVVYCQGATNATALTAGGTNLLWYLTVTGGTGTSTAPIPSTATVGSTTYYVTQNPGNCESPRASIVVTINATPAAPGVTPTLNYCLNATANPLSATPATGATLNWYGTNATGGTASSTPNTPLTTTVGSIQYYVSQTLGNCEGPRAVITVNVGALPAAPGTSNLSYCQGATAAPLTATAATGGTLIWYGTNSSGGTGSSTAPTPPITAVGSITYYVSQIISGCESPRASIIITVNATPPAPSVSTTPVVYCQGATPIALLATPATGATLIWYGTAATGGTPSPTAPIPPTATVGTLIYYVSQSIGTCEGPRAQITVTVNATPAAPTVTVPPTYCLNATATALSATAAPGATLIWYGTNATGGTPSSTPTIPTTSASGTITYYVSQSLGNCEGPRAPIVVTVAAATPAPTVTPVPYCQGATAVPLTATAATGATLIWYSQASGGPAIPTPTPPTTTVGTQTYYVSQTIGTCEGPRAALVVTIAARPAAPIVVSPIPYCQNGNAVPLTAQGTGLIYYTVPTGGTGVATLTPSVASAGSTTYYVSQTTGTCEGPRAAIVVNVSPSLTANAGNPVTIARGDQTQLNGVGTPGARYLWTSNISPLALVNAPVSQTTLNPIANPLQTTIYTLTVSDPNTPAVCPSATSSVQITVVSTCINVKNAFTPNGDGINDRWVVYEQAFCLKPGGVTVNVFNRYGSRVFESKNYTNSWDGTYKGKPVPDGTYYAVVEFQLLNGGKQTVRTDVTVLR